MVEKDNKMKIEKIPLETKVSILSKKVGTLFEVREKLFLLIYDTRNLVFISLILLAITAVIAGFLTYNIHEMKEKLDGYEEVCFDWEIKEKYILISPISDSIFCIKKIHFGCESGLCYVEESYRYCIPTKFENGIFTEYNYSNELLEAYIYTYEEKICNETILKKIN